MRKAPLVAAAIVFALGLSLAPRFLISKVASGSDFVNFESAHVHPIVLTPDNTKLLAVNTPDNRLVVFDLTGVAPVRTLQIPVGLEPVAVAARSDTEAWVVNHVSDDVSVVDLATGNVRATLRVGDEPYDVASFQLNFPVDELSV
jgi:YVTN family beta-propeller protein